MSKIRYRLKFEKVDKMKFVGHLDLLRLFQRAIRRAKLPIHYSGGFNPHQETIFAMPLTLGMDTIYDIIDIRLTEERDIVDIKNGINAELPQGFKISEVRRVNDDEKNCAKELIAADYVLKSKKIDFLILARIIEIVMKSEECLIEKQSKKTTKEVNIRDDIYELRLCENGLYIKVATGSKRHLKPELLYEYFCTLTKDEFDLTDLKVKRLAMYKYDENENLINLF